MLQEPFLKKYNNVMVVFQSFFHLKIYQNDVFFLKKLFLISENTKKILI